MMNDALDRIRRKEARENDEKISKNRMEKKRRLKENVSLEAEKSVQN